MRHLSTAARLVREVLPYVQLAFALVVALVDIANWGGR